MMKPMERQLPREEDMAGGRASLLDAECGPHVSPFAEDGSLGSDRVSPQRKLPSRGLTVRLCNPQSTTLRDSKESRPSPRVTTVPFYRGENQGSAEKVTHSQCVTPHSTHSQFRFNMGTR